MNKRSTFHSSPFSNSMPPHLSSFAKEEEEDDDEVSKTLPRRKKKVLSKQLSMIETTRELKWEKRKRQMYLRSASNGAADGAKARSLTDEDLDELKGSLELGFGFDEEKGGHELLKTLPALNLYFAVHRQMSGLRQTPSPASTPTTSSSSLYGTPSSSSSNDDDTWKIYRPGDSPQHVKQRLRHWAQIVACTVRHSF